MSLAFYVDVHFPRAVTSSLRIRGVDVLTAQEDESAEADDEQLLARSVELGRLFVTQDRDFLSIAAEWQAVGKPFHGIVYAPQLESPIGP